MDQLLIPVDAEQAVIDELTPAYTIGTSIPDPKPDLFLRVIAVGGTSRDLVTDRPILTLEAFALKESDASDALGYALGLLGLAARNGRIGVETAYGLEVAGLPQNNPLPSVPSHVRYTATIVPALRRRVTTL